MERPILLKDIDVVIYHKNCQDGINSAFIFKYACKKKKKYIKMIGSLHDGNEIDLEEIRGKNVIMVDIVTENVDLIKEMSNNFYALDHHISSYEKRKLENNIYFDMNKCGTTLAYEYVYYDKEPPEFIKCIQARDLWTWDVEKAKEFTTGFYELGNDRDVNLYEVFKELIEEDKNEKFNEISILGEKIIEKVNNRINELFNDIVITNVKINKEDNKDDEEKKNKEYKIIKMQVNDEDYRIRSDFGNYCVKNTDVDFIVIYKYNENNDEYYCSLRSMKGRFDLNAEGMAKGHACAAGLTLNIHPDNYFVNTD